MVYRSYKRELAGTKNRHLLTTWFNKDLRVLKYSESIAAGVFKKNKVHQNANKYKNAGQMLTWVGCDIINKI